MAMSMIQKNQISVKSIGMIVCLFALVAIIPKTDVLAGDVVSELMQATFKISNPGSTATCFVISRPDGSDAGKRELVLVTAAHVFDQMNGDECFLVSRNKNEDGSYSRNEILVKVRSEDKPLWVSHGQADVAALILKIPAGQSIASISIEQIAKGNSEGLGAVSCADDVWIPGYPAQLEANKAGFSVLRRGTVASFPVDYDKPYLISASTFAGDSGAPVAMLNRSSSSDSEQGKDAKRLMIVGLVSGMQRMTTKTKSIIEERTVHRPLGLAIIVHAKLIHQTIDKLSK